MTDRIALGGGCFWCLEAAYQIVKGVKSVRSGYAGGKTVNPTYTEVCRGVTSHAEVVRIEFNDKIVSLKQILEVFFTIHDPTSVNRQGSDVGAQYRSIILYERPPQLKTINDTIKEMARLWHEPLSTEVQPLNVFYPSEPEHNNYFRNHPEAMYCQAVINPKLNKLRRQLASLTT